MKKKFKKRLFIIYFSLTLFNCRGQSYNEKIESFLSKFIEFQFPVDPSKLLGERERKGDFKILKISKKNYDEFLHEKGDSLWYFSDKYEFSYIGKKKIENYWILLYYRGYLSDDVNLQRSEFIISTFSFQGKIISVLPITGGYGDSLVFTSIIGGVNNICVNYTSYKNDKEEKYTKHYFIDNKGFFILRRKD